jgi:hypothetical protein
VVEEADAGGDVNDLGVGRTWPTVEVERELDLSLARLSRDRSRTSRHNAKETEGGKVKGRSQKAKIMTSSSSAEAAGLRSRYCTFSQQEHGVRSFVHPAVLNMR